MYAHTLLDIPTIWCNDSNNYLHGCSPRIVLLNSTPSCAPAFPHTLLHSLPCRYCLFGDTVNVSEAPCIRYVKAANVSAGERVLRGTH